MTRSELVEAVAVKYPSIAKRDIETVIHQMFESMTHALMQDQRVEIRGFGSFSVKVRQAREGRNPKTGDMVAVPTKRTPFWTAGKELRERVNGGRDSGEAN